MFLLEFISSTAGLFYVWSLGSGRYRKSQRQIALLTAHSDSIHFVRASNSVICIVTSPVNFGGYGNTSLLLLLPLHAKLYNLAITLPISSHHRTHPRSNTIFSLSVLHIAANPSLSPTKSFSERALNNNLRVRTTGQ